MPQAEHVFQLQRGLAEQDLFLRRILGLHIEKTEGAVQMVAYPDFLQEVIRDILTLEKPFKHDSVLFLFPHLLHDAHAVILGQLGDGDFPGHFKKGKIVRFAPVDNIPGHLLEIHSRVDDDAGAFRLFHGSDQMKQPAVNPGLQSGGDSQLLSAETVDYCFILKHVHPADYVVHPIFSS